MGTRTDNTIQELITKWMKELAAYKLQAPDSEQELISAIEDGFMQIARMPIENVAQQGLTSAPPQMAQPDMGQPQMPGPQMQAVQGAGVPGVRNAAGPANSDELRRMLSYTGGGQ